MMQFFANISGLARLAQQFPLDQSINQPTRSNHTVKIGFVRYRNCATVEAMSQGLFLSIHPPMGKQFPLLIPWQQITKFTDARLYGRKAICLFIQGQDNATITIYKGLFEQIRPFSQPI